tara:strand:+ start:27011 stop:28876 length:1866 start_codon:yes stop_codon:yes gene_type:complete
MYTFIYNNPEGELTEFKHHIKEDARDQAQAAFFVDYKAGKWVGKSSSGCIVEGGYVDEPEEGVQHLLIGAPGQPSIANGNTWAESRIEPEDTSTERSGVDAFMQDVCDDDEPADVEGMASEYDNTTNVLDMLSEDMNPVTEEAVAQATTSQLEIAMAEDPQVREVTPTFQGGWGSGDNGVSNHSDKRTVDYGKVSEVAKERQELHDTWLAELGLSRPTENISITKAGYERGTAVVDLGYDNLAVARTTWDNKPDATTAANDFFKCIKREEREDIVLELSELRMQDDGSLTTGMGGQSLVFEEHGLKQLLAATRFGAKGDRSEAVGPLFPRAFETMKALDPDVRAYVFNEHMKRHCSYDKAMMFRTRKNVNKRSIFGVVGEKYQPYDADKVACMVANAVQDMPFKAELKYNADTTNLMMDITMHAPEDLVDFSAGELYEVGFRFKSNDRGGGSINGSAIAFWNECLNMIILHSQKKEVMRAIHKGNMAEKMQAIREAMNAARPAMERFAQHWGILAHASAQSMISNKDIDDYATDGDTSPHILIKKLVAEGKVASGIGRDAAVQMMFNSYADQGGGDTVQDVINAITRMAHQHLVNDCARDTLEREAGLLVPVLAQQATAIA